MIDDEMLAEDKEEDRTFLHEHVGRQIKSLYESGWATGTVMYFNRKLQRLKVDFPDSEDSNYVALNEIDGVEVILV